MAKAEVRVCTSINCQTVSSSLGLLLKDFRHEVNSAQSSVHPEDKSFHYFWKDWPWVSSLPTASISALAWHLLFFCLSLSLGSCLLLARSVVSMIEKLLHSVQGD